MCIIFGGDRAVPISLGGCSKAEIKLLSCLGCMSLEHLSKNSDVLAIGMSQFSLC